MTHSPRHPSGAVDTLTDAPGIHDDPPQPGQCDTCRRRTLINDDGECERCTLDRDTADYYAAPNAQVA